MVDVCAAAKRQAPLMHRETLTQEECPMTPTEPGRTNNSAEAMRLMVLGATGRTGRELVSQAVTGGHSVTVLVRDAAALEALSGSVTTVTGSATDPAAVDKAVAGVDAVLSLLGHTPNNSPDVMTQAVRTVIDSMRKHGAKRLVVLTNASVRADSDAPTVMQRLTWSVFGLIKPAVGSDHRGQVDLLVRTDLDWTIVRTVTLSDGPVVGNIRVGRLDSSAGRAIRRADVAAFMLAAVVEGKYVREMPLVSQ